MRRGFTARCKQAPCHNCSRRPHNQGARQPYESRLQAAWWTYGWVISWCRFRVIWLLSISRHTVIARWQSLMCYVTVVSTLADFYLHDTSHSAAALLKPFHLGRSLNTLPFRLHLSADWFWDPRSIEHIWSQLPERSWSSVEFLFWRFTRDLFPVSCSINKVLLLCPPFGFFLCC